MKQQWLIWQQKFDALVTRERLLVFAVAIVVVYVLMQIVVLDPLLKQRGVKRLQILQYEGQVSDLENSRTILNAQLSVGVNREREQQREQLKAQTQALDNEIERSVLAMIPPQKMAEVLEAVLLGDNHLKLISVENQPALPVQTAAAEAPVTTVAGHRQTVVPNDTPALYQHSFVITLEGNYPATIDYFKRLAALPWKFYWDSLDYSVDRFPKATITLKVHTVSLSEEWIGV